MGDRRFENHPDLDHLLDHEARRLEADESQQIAAHLAECPLCRLELQRRLDFESADQDDEALADAGWDGAELELQRRFTAEVLPEAAATRSRRRPSRWIALAPVAAAAVLAVLFLSLDRIPDPGTGWNGGDTLRGGSPMAPDIELIAPLDEVAQAPREFVWRSDTKYDSYGLEVFDPDLKSIFRLADLRTTRVAIPDSLAARLEPGATYLWNVRGRKGLADAELSLTSWFRIGPERELPAPQGG